MLSRILVVFVITMHILVLMFVNSEAVPRTNLWPKMCASCHDGKTALSKESLREKYLTVSAFSDAVVSKGGRCMNILKNDKKMIGNIAEEIGLKKD